MEEVEEQAEPFDLEELPHMDLAESFGCLCGGPVTSAAAVVDADAAVEFLAPELEAVDVAVGSVDSIEPDTAEPTRECD